jgi:hypothetical protein
MATPGAAFPGPVLIRDISIRPIRCEIVQPGLRTYNGASRAFESSRLVDSRPVSLEHGLLGSSAG